MSRAVRFCLIGVLACVLATGGSAGAHPHIWIEYSVSALFGEAGLETVEFTWTFDDFSSSMIMREFDTDRNGALSPAEIGNIEQRHFAETRAAQYFVVMRLNDVPVPVDSVRGFTARVAGGRITYVFTVPVKRSQGAEGRLEVLAEDPTLFAAFDLVAREPVQFRAPKGVTATCQAVKDPKGAVLDFVRCTYKRGAR